MWAEISSIILLGLLLPPIQRAIYRKLSNKILAYLSTAAVTAILFLALLALFNPQILPWKSFT